jgi:hypothetical protein
MASTQSELAVDDGDGFDPVDPLFGADVFGSFAVVGASPDDESDEPSPPSPAGDVVEAGLARRSFLAQPEPL